ncbi:MAG: hypothetical protein RL494_1783 [Bacteroidota bacterium]
MKLKTLFLKGILFFALISYAQNPNSNIYYKINPTHSNHFLSVSANMFKNGTQIIQWENPPNTCEDGQAYKFEKVNAYYKITARNKFGKCLTLTEQKNGANIVLDDFKNSDLQLWKIEHLGNDVYSIKNKDTNLGFDIYGRDVNNGAYLTVWEYVGNSNQKFKLIPAEEETPYWENLGPEINTSQSDYAPCFSPDGKTLFFSRGDTKGNYIYNSKVYKATQNPDGSWGNVKHMPEFDFGENGRVVSFLPGGNEIIIFGDFTGGDDMFSIVEKTENGWSKPKPMGIKKPKIKYNTWTGFLASDGRTFIIEMNLTDRNDESDLYVSFKSDNGKWSAPKYMGDVINKQKQWDGTPYLSPDMKSLYYNASREGRHGTDIYVTRRLDDTWLKWSEPERIDKGIYIYSVIQNYSIPGNGEYGYFVSGMKTFGEGDIFRMKVSPTQRPEAFLTINGNTLNAKNKKAVSAKIYFEDLESGKRMGEVNSNPSTGAYQIMLPKGKNYGIYASSDGFYSVNENIETKDLSNFKTVEKNILLFPVEKGETIRLNNIFFDFGKATLRKESYPELERVIALLEKNQKLKIEIQGHTDNVGDDNSNLILSENRAKAVKEYILKNGIKENQIASKGFGESKPIVPNTTDANRQENRRVDFLIL